MKTITLILISAIIFSMTCMAQDIIYKIDGVEIKASVLEITKNVIKYKIFEQQTGPIRNIEISEVFMIIYGDGTRENFKINNNLETKNPNTYPQKENTPKSKITLPDTDSHTEMNVESKDLITNTKKDSIELTSAEAKTSIKKPVFIPGWGLSVGYTRFVFSNETSKNVYSGLNGFEAKLFYRWQKEEIGVFINSQGADGNPIEYGNVPPGATCNMKIFIMGIETKGFLGKVFYFSLRTGYISIKEELSAFDQTASGSLNEWLFSPGIGLDIPLGDNLGVSASTKYDFRGGSSLNGWNFGVGLFVTF